MNPLTLLMMQAMMQQDQAGQAGTPLNASDRLGSVLGAVQPQEPHRTPVPYTTTPDAPRALNPALTQQLMQLLMSLNRPPAATPTLGALLGGR